MTHKAFTLMEILVVVVLLGILAAVVIPKFANAQDDARIASTAEDLRLMEVGLGMYQANNGGFPVDVNPELMPSGLEPYFKTKNPFAKSVPIGGVYDYEGAPNWSPIQISIRDVGSNSHSTADALALDRFMDDGDLTTGSIRQDGTRTYFIIH